MTPKAIRIFFAMFLLFVIFFAFGSDLARIKNGGFFSDESTYFAIMQSLAFDGDLEYTREDIMRIRREYWVGPMGLFLKQARDGRLYYAKSFIHPLALAPFFRLWGSHGILLANGLMLFLVVLMGFLLLRRFHEPGRSLAFTLVYVFGSVSFIYVWWVTADLFNFFVNFAALFFFFYEFKRPAWGYAAALFMAAAVFSKPNNLLHFGLLFLLLLHRRQWKRFVILGLLCVLFLGALFAFNYVQTGEVNYQGGERRSFYGNFPLERDDFSFAGGYKMSTDTYWNRFFLSPAIAVLNAFYFFFGRFTGMLLYFPPAFFLLLFFFFQRKHASDWFLLAAIAAAILCCILLMPDNYFGGGGSLGNRYFLSIYPLFFFLGLRERRLRSPLVSLAPVAAAIIFLSPVLLNGLQHSAFPRYPGLSFPIRLFPPEKTQYATLPSNTNPRAFNRRIAGKYTLFFLNDNYNPIEGEAFWTHADKQLELFVLAPGKVQRFTFQLKNIPRDNHVRLQVEHKARTVFIPAGEVRSVSFSHVPGLRFFSRYLYLVKIKSRKYFCPFFADPATQDRRLLGVQAHLLLEY
ncbi:MAG: hypothetical protein JXO51_08010 [Candidatus Aminicenantes bacterium]|nr:hypothetical protein [Candidatus Aminicenantes bacterium]